MLSLMFGCLNCGWPPRILSIFTLIVQSILFVTISLAQASPASKIESTQDLTARLTEQQKAQFDDATKAFGAQHYTDALVIFKLLLGQLPGDSVLSKFSSEAALDAGDASYALKTVGPLAQANPNDWQAVALVTRACAESGGTTCRDSGIANMLDLYRRGVVPKQMQQYVVERLKSGANTLLIRTSLEPWGYYHVYDLGQVMDREGNIFLRITIESSDGDQALFAKENPKEAAAGLRSFSLDAYRETGLNSSGQRTQTHYTFKFFTGQPPYQTVREEFIKVASGESTAISSRSNLVVP